VHAGPSRDARRSDGRVAQRLGSTAGWPWA
jgi:hypothetical protein